MMDALGFTVLVARRYAEIMRVIRTILLYCLPLGLALAVVGLASADWNRFRGPNGSGVSDDTSIPTEWSATKNVRWKIKLSGRGFSSPIIVGNRVLVTCYTGSVNDRDLVRYLLCVDRTNGKVLWTKSVPAVYPEFRSLGRFAYHGYASSSPVSDGKRVYVHFGTTGLIAFDMDGKKLWQKDIGREQNSKFGSASSPILYKDLVIVTAGAESESMRAFDKVTGREVWKAVGSSLSGGYGTPVIGKNAKGEDEVLIYVPNEVWSLDTKTGKLRWFAETGSSGNICSSLVVHKGIAYAAGGGGFGRPNAVALRIGGKGDRSQANRMWTSRGGPYVPSPVYYNGLLFWIEQRGPLVCVDAKTGERLNSRRLEGDFYASPIVVNGRLYAVSRFDGGYVLSADKELKLIARNSLGDDSDFSGTPAIDGGQMWLRSDAYLYCIQKSKS